MELVRSLVMKPLSSNVWQNLSSKGVAAVLLIGCVTLLLLLKTTFPVRDQNVINKIEAVLRDREDVKSRFGAGLKIQFQSKHSFRERTLRLKEISGKYFFRVEGNSGKGTVIVDWIQSGQGDSIQIRQVTFL